jgi:hypothetical protein
MRHIGNKSSRRRHVMSEQGGMILLQDEPSNPKELVHRCVEGPLKYI